MNDKRQNDQLELAFDPIGKGEARTEDRKDRIVHGERWQRKPGGRPTDGGGTEPRELEEGTGASPSEQRRPGRRWNDGYDWVVDITWKSSLTGSTTTP